MIDEALLSELRSDRLRGVAIRVSHAASEVRCYDLIECVGEGASGVAWKARDSLQRAWAIKFVSKKDYADHSLQAEAERVNGLASGRFEPIDFFGTPICPGITAADQLYAIVAAWVDGPTLLSHLHSNPPAVSVQTLLALARDFLAALADLQKNGLCHNDLHDDNVLVVTESDSITGAASHRIKIIDTGQLKLESRRLALLDRWVNSLEELTQLEVKGDSADLLTRKARYEKWINWFQRTDHEWFVYHICSIFNCLRSRLADLDVPSRRFLRELPNLLDLLIDPDPSRRLTEPRRILQELQSLWANARRPSEPQMSSPFDFMSAELIRSDRQLMDLFSDEFPGLSECRSNDPIYLYGPRGCGKSTILRSLALKAILASGRIEGELAKVPFCGVYVSCSSELRSRFWLLPEDDYDLLEGHIVRYFSLLLLEELIETLTICRDWDEHSPDAILFGVTESAASELTLRLHQRVFLDYSGTQAATSFEGLLVEMRLERERLWGQILDRHQPNMRSDAQLIFDSCDIIAQKCPVFQSRRIVFLLDDYSSQRIPFALQRRLNQAITFAKQANPIFKVTSEYDGVDLAGVQEGREVREVNVGQKYVTMSGATRWRFLQNILEKRFLYLKTPVNLLACFPLSNLPPAIPMARAIREAFDKRKRFCYYGFDTISDLCSGDFATGLDLVRKIVEDGGHDWRAIPRPVPVDDQHKAIERFAAKELDSVRYLAPNGRAKFNVMDRLCWLAREVVIRKDTSKNGEVIPLIKTHLDISEKAWGELLADKDNADILLTLIRKGLLFSLDTSKARERRDGTRRYQIRRILLARYGSPLGRHFPIRIDDLETLRFLLTEPAEFATRELGLDPRQMGLGIEGNVMPEE